MYNLVSWFVPLLPFQGNGGAGGEQKNTKPQTKNNKKNPVVNKLTGTLMKTGWSLHMF